MAQVVLRDVLGDLELPSGNLFQGLKFWLSQKVPQRSRFINDIRANRGEIKPLEKDANVKIVDHARKETLPGTYVSALSEKDPQRLFRILNIASRHSYTFIEESIRNGVLADLQDHRAGPPEGTVRSVGSIVQPAKGTRKKFTQTDDYILWNWVNETPQKFGGTDGNEIYKQLETQHNQHPWQSWRDRYIKQLKGKPCPFPPPQNAPPTPPSDIPLVNDDSAAVKATAESPRKISAVAHNPPSFTEVDAEALLDSGADIMDIDPERVAEAWENWARSYDDEQMHSAQDWQTFWEEQIRPRYIRRLSKQNESSTVGKAKADRSPTPTRMVGSKTLVPTGEDRMIAEALSSPPYRPESPSMQLQSPPLVRQSPNKIKLVTGLDRPYDLQENGHSIEQILPTADGKAKRKRAILEDEIPSSSPPESMRTPKRIRQNMSGSVREIASTPDRIPTGTGNRPDSPLFINSEDEEEEDSVKSEDIDTNNESPLGKEPSETLSEPERKNVDTQDIFNDITQKIDLETPPPDEGPENSDTLLQDSTEFIDLEVPLPDEGWDDEDSGAEASSESEPTATNIHDQQRASRQGTQAFFRGQTAIPDFNVAEPEGGWDHVIPSSPPPIPSSPPAEESESSSDVEAETDAWIDAHVTDELSIDEVLLALKSCSMNTDLAEEVLESLKKNENESKILPENKRGVWTETDDGDLYATDARKIERLEAKHGKGCVDARFEFLSFYASA